MPLRVLEVLLPEVEQSEAKGVIEAHQPLALWFQPVSENRILARVLLPTQDTEPMMDALERRFSMLEGFRLILSAVEASVPRVEPSAGDAIPRADSQTPVDSPPNATRVSREELYATLWETTNVSSVFVISVILSSMVAAVGLLRNNMAVVIGAMVIAPLLGPNMALALATTLGDLRLARRALKASAVGIVIALAFAAMIGLSFPVDLHGSEIASRTRVGLADMVLALASGVAGAIAFTAGVSSSLIGVMVAVALLPPLVTVGMLSGGGYWPEAVCALLLLLSNIGCVNLAGVCTFVAQGIHPKSWWEAEKAKRATRTALLAWSLLLLALAAVIVLSRHQ